MLPLLKKPGLDMEQMSSYWPLSNLTAVLKVIKQLVLSRLRHYVFSSKRTLHGCSRCIALHTSPHIVNMAYMANNNKKVTVLVDLDISAVFDTIDHPMFIECLSPSSASVVNLVEIPSAVPEILHAQTKQVAQLSQRDRMTHELLQFAKL